ncbi:MAG: ATP-dependent Clp protease ATP-binding subunit [Oscillospiraceae bacterium]|nr:ATP-dependent Clp protease ATP-binding subunit [Oscillospiraceae bacterium]
MLMCSKCKKRTAVVFVTAMHGNEKKNEGYCLQCARELGISQVDEMLKSTGLTDEEIENMTGQLMDITDGEDFELGGSGTMPNFLNSIFGGISDKDSESGDSPANIFEGLMGGKKDKSKDKDKKKKLKFLTNYCTNLTEKAREGKLDNIIGRDKEIARVVQILSRRQKNNPCLIGEPGVGKTAIAEGIAQKIVADEVPFHIRGKEVYLLDLTALVAGTQFRGQFESRVKGLVEEVKSLGNVILFIDEVHNLVGTGDSEGTMNAANILKPALSRGEVQVIAATTFKEYRKHIEKDAALERRFQPVTVSEPTVEDTIHILNGIRGYYENHHKVKIDDYTLKMCAVLSERYINDRFLPDKAIDLLDEACACTSIRSTELEEHQKTLDELKKHKDLVESYEASENPDYENLATEKAEVLRLEEKLKELEEKIKEIRVTEEDLSKVIELWTGIPANKIVETEYSKIRNIRSALEKRIIGQEKAVETVANAIKRARVQLSKRRRPASFIFVGPTGVGKTELVKVLGEELFDATEPIIRVDMSEFMEKHSVARLIGSPPGYVGYDEAGQLTEKVRRRPYSVVLFDEIEKAHPDVMNIMLQILDEGKINDAQGRSVSFENTVIVMTSNAGSTDKDTGVGFNKTETEISRDKAMKALREFLRPEFLGRVDEIVVFNPLTVEDYTKIAGLMLDEMKEPLLEKNIKFVYDEKACKLIAEKSHGKKLGARDIRQVIRSEVEDKLASILIDSDEIITACALTEKDGELVVETM